MDIDRAILKALLNGNHVLRFGQMYVVIALKYHMFYWSSSLLFVICFVCLFISKGPNVSPSHQLSLALIWNRADIAKCEIFREDRKWEVTAKSLLLFLLFSFLTIWRNS